jgi:ferredoxin
MPASALAKAARVDLRQLSSRGAASARRPRRATAAPPRADDAMCRDMVNGPRAGPADVAGASVVVFLGAGGASVEVSAPKGEYILDAGLAAGLELPFTCRGGICGACVGRVAEGEVDMSDIADLSFTVSDEEAAQGMALLCMARPVSDRVVIETQSDWGYSLGVGEWKGATGEIRGKAVEPLMGKKWDA